MKLSGFTGTMLFPPAGSLAPAWAEPGLNWAVNGDFPGTGGWTRTPATETGRAGRPLPASMENGALRFNISPADHTSYYLVRQAAANP